MRFLTAIECFAFSALQSAFLDGMFLCDHYCSTSVFCMYYLHKRPEVFASGIPYETGQLHEAFSYDKESLTTSFCTQKVLRNTFQSVLKAVMEHY